jgi:hypothetical protein
LTKRKATNASKAADSKNERINAMRRGDIGANSQMALADEARRERKYETEAHKPPRAVLLCHGGASC